MSRTFDALLKAEKDKPSGVNAKIFSNPGIFSPKKDPHKFKVITWITEEYKRMKQHISSLSEVNEIKAILFTSSKSEEGTSTVLFNFAIDLVNDGEKVIIVDANLRTPAIHSFLSLEQENGFSELIYGQKSIDQALKKTEIKNLTVITSGSPVTNPSTGLASVKLPALIQELKIKADWILVDSPPIHDYNDSCILADKLDGVILIIQAEKTKWEVVQSAKERISRNDIKLLGAILNKKQMHIPNWLYKLI